jgi:hypothetical protein
MTLYFEGYSFLSETLILLYFDRFFMPLYIGKFTVSYIS